MSEGALIAGKFIAALAVLSESERARALDVVMLAFPDYRSRIQARDRKRKERDSSVTIAGHKQDSGVTDRDDVPPMSRLGDKGGSPISDLQSPYPLQSPTLSSLGSPTPVKGSTGKTSEGVTSGRTGADGKPHQGGRDAASPTPPSHLSPGGGSEEPGAFPIAGKDLAAPAAIERPTTVTTAADRGLEKGPRSPGTTTAPDANADWGLTGETAPGAQGVTSSPSAGSGSSTSAPARRFNPAAIVDAFAAGVNEAGGTWTCASGKPFTDLAAALQPHTSRAYGAATGQTKSIPVWMHQLGLRWFAYCAGMPRDAWKAAAWLGEGAPERPRSAMPQRPDEAAQDVHERSRAVERRQAPRRDAEYKRRECEAVRAPPEVQAQLNALWSPASEVRVKTAEEQAATLLASGGDE
jgi:hypothetical protein